MSKPKSIALPQSWIIGLSLCLGLLCISFSPAYAQSNIKEYKLSNGLKVIVKPDRRAPVIVSQIWYRVGSVDETNGITGVSHVLEHMMFKGTKHIPAGQFSKLIAAAGGRENAFTSRDYTAYFEQLEKSQLPLAFRLEADRMSNLKLSEQEFEKEIKVVMEERRWRTDDKPQAMVYEQLMAVAYQVASYRYPIIGWMNDLENMTLADAQAWYERWYVPNNAILVVVGDVEPAAVHALAKKYFGKIKRGPTIVRKAEKEPPQLGIKRVVVKAPAKLPYLLMGYHVPVLRDPEKDWEPYALEMLVGVLDGNASARLNQSLVREAEIANDVGAGYDSIARGPGMLMLEGTPREGKTVEQLEAALRNQIDKIINEGITEEELQRVKAQIIAAQIYQRDSMFYQAMLIGEMEAIGFSHDLVERRIEKLKQVSASQVQEVAKKFLRDDVLTVATLDPQPLENKATAAPPKGLHHAK